MKILVLTNNLVDTDTLSKGLALAKQYALSIGLPLQYDFRDTKKQFSSVPVVNNIVLNGHVVNPVEIFQEAKTFGIPFDCTLLIYDWTKISPQPTNPDDGGMAMSIPMQWYGKFPEVFAEFLLHELCHFLFQSTGQVDKTHFKYDPQWNGIFNQKSNIVYYLYLLKPLIPLYKPQIAPLPIVMITRQSADSKQNLGILRTSDGGFGCDTLERAWVNNQQNISCIPTGTYTCQWKFMLRELTYHYQIMNVPGRSGIFIHAGNYFFNSAGCILLGSLPQDTNSDGEKDLINSKIILSAFEKKMNRQPFQLQIL